MTEDLDHTNLHRTAKYFMDNGRAPTHEAALDLLQQFGLTIKVGEEIFQSVPHQTALLTLINVARRTLLAGVEIIGLTDGHCHSPLAYMVPLQEAVVSLGGKIVSRARPNWPVALIGTTDAQQERTPCWRLTWEGWRGGVVPERHEQRLAEDEAVAVAPAFAAAACAAEAFAYHAGDHPMAGRRSAGLSLWQPGINWLASDPTEPRLTFLPSRLWLIGLGNLGQAFAWLLACLPYADRSQIVLMLQDFDRIAPSNESTSLLSAVTNVGQLKTRAVSEWLEARGFHTLLEERRFGHWTQRTADEPNVALCGVDNGFARAELESAGFELVVEAGLGAGPQAFRSISLHSFPGSRSAKEIWSRTLSESSTNIEEMPAYQELRRNGMDGCGLHQIASRTVGVPFVGLVAGALVISELLRRLHGGNNFELASGSVAVLDDFETVAMPARSYPGAYTYSDQKCELSAIALP